MGIRQLLLAVNKIDLVDFKQEVFAEIAAELGRFAAECGVERVEAIPVCAIDGDNLVRSSSRTEWYRGPTLVEALETIQPAPAGTAPMRMPVQYVIRHAESDRALCGRIVSGQVNVGDRVAVLPSGAEACVSAIVARCGQPIHAVAGESTTLVLDRAVDVGRGDVLAAIADPPSVADQFQATMLWLGEHDLIAGRPYLLKQHAREVTASVIEIRHRVDIDSGAELAANALSLNDIGVVKIVTSQPLVWEPYRASRTLGGFVLIDKLTYDTVAAGMLQFALRRASNIRWQTLEIDGAARARLKQQSARCIWLTGLSASGKSSIANLLEKRLHAAGRHTYILDGDNIRHGLNRDLGFTEADRAENVRRVAEVARLIVDAGLIVVVAFISPFRAERRLARALFAEGQFVEVFVDTTLEECERRDPKGLYAKARSGLLPNFTGFDSPYEPPEAPDVHVVTAGRTVEECVEQLFQHLQHLS